MNRWSRFSLIACLGVVLCFGQNAGAPRSAPLLTLDEALDLAARQNRQLAIDTLDVAKSTERTNQAKTQRLPVFKVYAQGGASLHEIDFTVPKGVFGVYPATGPIPAQTATIKTPESFTGLLYVSASQPLSQLYKVHLAIQESKVAEQLAREQLRLQRQSTTEAVKQAYYQLAQVESQIASANAALQYLQELAAYTERNVQQETALKMDSLSIKAKLSQQQYQLLTFRNARDTQREVLNRLLGRDFATDFAVELQPLPSLDETDLSAAQHRALRQRPEMEEARLQNRKSELEVRRERAEYLPDVSLHVSYLSFPNVSFLPQNVATAGVLLEWQPFDWGFKKHKIAELRNSSKQSTLSERDVQQQVLLDVNASFRKLAETRALLGAQLALQEVEREKLRVIANRYEQKSALLTDVLQQQNALAQADSQYGQALSGFWTAKAAFDRALGEQ